MWRLPVGGSCMRPAFVEFILADVRKFAWVAFSSWATHTNPAGKGTAGWSSHRSRVCECPILSVNVFEFPEESLTGSRNPIPSFQLDQPQSLEKTIRSLETRLIVSQVTRRVLVTNNPEAVLISSDEESIVSPCKLLECHP